MVLKLYFKFAQKVVEECLILKHYLNIKKYVKKFFNQKEKPLIPLLIELPKHKIIFHLCLQQKWR